MLVNMHFYKNAKSKKPYKTVSLLPQVVPEKTPEEIEYIKRVVRRLKEQEKCQ